MSDSPAARRILDTAMQTRAQTPDLSSRQIAAIRACGAHPGGLRISAYPGTMPGLVALGLVEQRAKVSPSERRQMGWFLTPAGKERLRLVGTGEPRGP